jgi:lysophospholipase L1-like esterase
MLSACGGGGGTLSGQQVAKPQPKAIVIDAEGDSTMWGFRPVNGGAVQVDGNPPALLQAALQQQFGPLVTVQNNAIPGMTMANRLEGTAPYSQPYSAWATSDHANIVIENFSLNDDTVTNNESPEMFQNYLVQFVSDSQAAGKTVVLEEPNACWNCPATLVNYVNVIDSVALQMNLPLVKQYDYTMSLPNWQSMLVDGIHPNDALYALKAQREADVIGPIVQHLMN